MTQAAQKPRDWVYHRTVRGSRGGNKGSIWIIEKPPARRAILYRDIGTDEVRPLTISMPRTLWIMSMHQVVERTPRHRNDDPSLLQMGMSQKYKPFRAHVCSTNKPFSAKRLDTEIFDTGLPNTGERCDLCTGSHWDLEDKKGSNEVETVDLYMQWLLFGSVWNEDLDWHYYALEENGVEDMYDWERSSKGKEGLKFGLRMLSRPAEVSLKHIVEDLTDELETLRG